MEDYREQLIYSINQLLETREIIFEQIINLAMISEYKYLNDTFEEGDTYTFSLEQFENVKDENIKLLVELCRKTEQNIFTLLDLNEIKTSEVNLDL